MYAWRRRGYGTCTTIDISNRGLSVEVYEYVSRDIVDTTGSFYRTNDSENMIQSTRS